ncbi:MAG: ABC-2 type transport system permease protein [Chloroflexi bacterium]|jgi:ABC-2 type transport system permease protein|nr:MAG: ABC-2 type transport system permease protein [Chloroflexota bacterium]
MTTTLAIMKKELVVYFKSPMAYIVAGVFLALTGVFFIDSVDTMFAVAEIRGLLLRSVFFLLPLIPPLLTMRLLAEEQKLGTLELLLTAPVRDYEVVFGKFIASFIILSGTVLLTLFYVLILSIYSNPDLGPIFSGYVGFLLCGGATLSIGLLASSLSGNQLVAAAVGFGVILLFNVIDQITTIVGGAVAKVLEAVSLTGHFDSFARGVIDTGDVVYYLVVMAFFLFLTIRSLESRRWR